jgi:rhomboid protease GluP
MPVMNPAAEALSPPTDADAAPPRDVSALTRHLPMTASEVPTAEALLRAVAAAKGPWYPSVYARRTSTPRHALDAPLAELREAGLVRVETWAKGLGQGYIATPDGERVAERVTHTDPGGPEPVTPTLVGLLDFRPPLITPALIGANVVWYAVGFVVALRQGQTASAALAAPLLTVVERLGGVSADDLLRGEWGRLVTCMFVHLGFWHLAMNTVALGTTGPVAELLWGRWRALAVYLIAGVAAAAAAMAFRPVGPGDVPVVVAGASGAIWGLMGAVLAWFVRYRHDLPPDVAADMGRRLAFAVLLNVGICLLPQVSWEGHAAGGFAGFVAAGLFDAARFNPRRRRLAAGALLLLVVPAAVAGLVLAMRYGDDWAPLRARAAPAPTTDPKPFLEPLRPEAAQAARWAAVRVWLVSPDFRAKARAAARAELDAIRGRVLAARDAVPAAHTAAGARLAELDRLRELVEQPIMPTVEEWQSWGDRRREADRLWASLNPP